MTDSDNNRLRLLAFLQSASKEAKRNPRYGAMEIRDFFDKIIPLLGDMFDCKAQSKKQHRNSDTLSNLEDHLPKLVANDLHSIQRLGSYAAHEGQFHTEEYPLKEASILHAAENGRRILDLFFPTSAKPKPRVDAANLASGPFLTDIKEATYCSYCNASFGEPCVTKDGREVGKGLEHTIRKRAYEWYRTSIRKGYGTTIINAMHEMVKEQQWSKGDYFETKHIFSYFETKYPAFKRSSIGAHINMMCTNSPSRTHHSQHRKPECQLFFKETAPGFPWISGTSFRLYDPKEDPDPIMQSDVASIFTSAQNELREKLMRGETLSTEELERLQRGE